jgi:benzylsuccinate CoA-transferase BbsF subunit
VSSVPGVNALPLEGVRVADFSWIIAGPTATRHLAMMGAEVIKVGSARRPDPSTGGAPFQVYNQSKLYCSLNLSTPQGLQLALRLVALSDIVVENYAVGVFERLGLGYEAVREARPDALMVSSSGTGHTGPDKDYVAYGSLLQSYTGWNSISGYPGGEPIKGGLWADPWVGMELAMIAVAALNHRVETGQGQYIDYSMAEALSATIPEAILDFQMNGRAPEPMGNSDAHHSPHGVFRCRGDDRWVAIEVTDSDQWRALCGLIGRPDLAADPGLSQAPGRRDRAAEIEAAVSEWTSGLEDYHAMELLQGAGVTAGPSLDFGRAYEDSELVEGGYLQPVDTDDGERRLLPTLPWRFVDGGAPRVSAAPSLGQHNGYVFEELLGLSKGEIEGLVEARVIY